MKLIGLIFSLLFFSLMSCSTKDVKDDALIAEKKEALQKAVCNTLVLNESASTDVQYFIWKKYGVFVNGHIGDMTKDDSCYYEAMKQIIIEDKGEDVIRVIVSEVKEQMEKPPIERLRYFDEVYGVLLNAKSIKGEGAKVVSENHYAKVLDSLSSIRNSVSQDLISFWITIDTTGSVEKIEFINQDCKKDIEEGIAKSFHALKWTPAHFGDTLVRYRFRENL